MSVVTLSSTKSGAIQTGGTSQEITASNPPKLKTSSDVNTIVNAPDISVDVNESPISRLLVSTDGVAPEPLASPQRVCANTGDDVSGPL